MTNFQISDRVNLAIDDDFKKILSNLKAQFPLLKEPDLIKMAVSGFYTNQNNSNSNTNTIQNKLLFEIRKIEIVKTKFFEETKNLYPDAYVFAVVNKIEPLYHLKYDNHLYSEYYNIPITCITAIQKFLDEFFNKTKKNEKIDLNCFDLYKISKKYNLNYNGQIESEEGRVFSILRYMFLSDRFRDYFKRIITNANEHVGISDFTRGFNVENDLDISN